MCYIEKYRSSGEPFCSEAKFSDEEVLARLAGLARQSRLHGKFSSQLAGLNFFHVIAKLIFSVFHRRAEIPANRASPVNRASRPPHVNGPLI